MESIDARVQQLLLSRQTAEAITEILRSFGPELRGYLRGTLGDPVEGDDVFQEISLALVEKINEFQFRSSLRTWCYAVAHNLVRKRFDSYSRKYGRRLDTAEQNNLATHSQTSQLERRRKAEALAAAVAQLSPAERSVLILHGEERASLSRRSLKSCL